MNPISIKIIINYPDILLLKKSGYSYNQINRLLFNNESTASEISNICFKIRKDEALKIFRKLVLLKPRMEYDNKFVNEAGFFAAPPHAEYNINDIISHEMILKIANPITKLRCKLLTRNFHINNKELFSINELSPNEITESLNLHNTIIDYFIDLLKRVEDQYLLYLQSIYK